MDFLMLSIFTNQASMAATKSTFNSTSGLNQSMQRLGTGKRLNSASDDAAGLQIATRLTSQTNGMKVAQKNISDGISLLQIAEGSLDEYSNTVYRMKDLATQAANGTNSQKDLQAIQKEFFALQDSAVDMIRTTSFGGQSLFYDAGGDDVPDEKKGLLTRKAGMTLQIGQSASETLNVNVNDGIWAIESILSSASGAFGRDKNNVVHDINGDNARDSIGMLEEVLDEVGKVRATLGAKQNRLGHTVSNLQNMQDNLSVGLGNIQDADHATEASRMSRSQMLAQTSMSMLKQSNSMSSMVQSLLS
ncbi:flagellin N-terminal helical domain-containing protein [Kluyvera cryocrescens]|uniref:flagellin N-terminal helical domain-containing protein n=1 Tax=Kluyvera cryocrescens TaxID=580 RepID=UPI002DB7F15B|nr:flagellin [Kluyvera cryocrescens]